MIHAVLDRQLMISINNKVGSLAEITSIISVSHINLVALCAYAVDDRVAIMFVTEDNNEAKRLLEERNYQVNEEEIVLLSINNKPGALEMVTKRIAEEGIDLKLIYGSVEPSNEISRLVLISESNLDVMMVIKTELERS